MADPSNTAYAGPERRTRRVYVTHNHEYHCKDGLCVAVRDVHTGEFLREHTAIGKKATGAVVLRGAGIASIAPPENASPGQRIHFAVDVDDRRDLLTSSLTSIERPPREVVAEYDQGVSAVLDKVS